MSEMLTEAPKLEENTPIRKPYVQPKLEVLGNFQTLTHGGTGSFDNGDGFTSESGTC